jgi:putative FmdB family regulatory protein
MPTYDYQCDACGHEFEKFQSITARPTRKCPACGKNKARRLIGIGAGVIFKGSGFYQTDYKNGGAKDKPAEAGSSGSGDSKPAAETKAASTESSKPASGETKSESKSKPKPEAAS